MMHGPPSQHCLGISHRSELKPTSLCRGLVAGHPEVQARVATELASLGLLATPENPSPRRLEFADLAKLTYLDAVTAPPLHTKWVFKQTGITLANLHPAVCYIRSRAPSARSVACCT